MDKKKPSLFLRLIGFGLGIGIGFFVVFQVLFLYRVIPHGGLW